MPKYKLKVELMSRPSKLQLAAACRYIRREPYDLFNLNSLKAHLKSNLNLHPMFRQRLRSQSLNNLCYKLKCSLVYNNFLESQRFKLKLKLHRAQPHSCGLSL